MYSRGSHKVTSGLKLRLKMSLNSSNNRSYCVVWLVQMIANEIQHANFHSKNTALYVVEMKNNATVVQ